MTANNALKAVLGLEQARGMLDQGEFQRGQRLLSRTVPKVFSTERDFLLAEALRGQGFMARAAAVYRGLLERADEGLWLDACLGLVACLRGLGETKEARRAWALGREAAAGQRGQLERLDLEGALLDRADGKFNRSLKALRRHLARFQRERDFSAAGYALWAMGGALRFSGDLAGSRRAFKESLRLARKSRDASAAAYALFGLGGVSRIQGKLDDSERFYRAALRQAAGDDVFGRAYAHCGLANVLRQKGQLQEAARLYRKAHILYRKLDDPVDLAYVDYGLGQIHMRQGRLAEARERLDLALRAFSGGGETRGIVLCELALAGLRHAQGHTAKAERLFSQACQRARGAGIHTHLEIYT